MEGEIDYEVEESVKEDGKTQRDIITERNYDDESFEDIQEDEITKTMEKMKKDQQVIDEDYADDFE